MTFDSWETRGITTRRLRYAFVASLLVHVLIFWPVSVRVLGEHTPSLLQTTLRPVRQPAVEPAPSKVPRAVSPAPTPVPPESRPSPPVLEPSGQLSVPQAAVVAVEKPVTQSPAALPATVSAAPAASAGFISGALITEANSTGEALDGLRGYRLALATQARRFKRYPAQAMASGWAGRADIRVEIGVDGRPQPATVVRSSGHEPLDKAALTMIDAGALRARLPESLRGKTFAVVLPVVFDLEEE